jgi:hypothetical protein
MPLVGRTLQASIDVLTARHNRRFTVEIYAIDSSIAERLGELNLAGIFGVWLAHGNIRILRRIERFLNRRRSRFRGNTKFVGRRSRVLLHVTQMRESTGMDIRTGDESHFAALRVPGKHIHRICRLHSALCDYRLHFDRVPIQTPDDLCALASNRLEGVQSTVKKVGRARIHERKLGSSVNAYPNASAR